MPSDAPVSSPAELGIDPAKLEALFERAEREVREGLLPSAQVAVARHGRLAGVRAFGAVTHEGQAAPATERTLYVIFSCTKALTSAATWLLVQDGKLDPNERVADALPGFGANGKESVTVEHLLTHTAGFPYAPLPPAEWRDPAARVARYATWRATFTPGSRMEYHPTSSMWVAAELVERRSGLSFSEFVRTRIAEPLGLADLHVGLPAHEHPRVADLVPAGDPIPPDELARMGFPAIAGTEVTEAALLGFNRRAAREAAIPGGSGIATASNLALFYQALLHDLRGEAPPLLFRRDVLEEALRVRTGELLDAMTGRRAHRALGMMVAGDEDRIFRGFGPTNSPRSFGHDGAGGQIAWADPETGISFAYLTNGMDRNPLRSGRRSVGLSARAAACLLA